ncbi:TetR/AcrR family transcriptional regulator [Stutzerimonas stutzeri]|uniref:TetR/AcrR family transcriptional regulator n=1 Tax=Stutzerimonas stutzeri TaxID=316 RepID=UPI002446850C|nr:TetR/AcrR family transcriptional regulator [Stutzerimonas stutzeri]MDH0426637.1 TetR/AcrR family transcriptional regulator [Stutzerimonas stutzeri]
MSKCFSRSGKRPPTETRRVMLEALGELLERKAPWDVRASEVAAASGTTQPNFYSHFRNIEDAILARSQQVWAIYPQEQLAAHLDEGLGGGSLEALQRFFVLTVEFWKAHGGLLRAVSRLSGDDHPSLREFRHQAQDVLIARCAAAIHRAQEFGTLSSKLYPQLAANAALRFLDEAASHYQVIREAGEFSSEEIVLTVTLQFRSLLCGESV